MALSVGISQGPLLLIIISGSLSNDDGQRQQKRHPKIYLYFICATSRLFQLAQLLQK